MYYMQTQDIHHAVWEQVLGSTGFATSGLTGASVRLLYAPCTRLPTHSSTSGKLSGHDCFQMRPDSAVWACEQASYATRWALI
jgi:hypothetical protein